MFAESGADVIVTDEDWPRRQLSGIDMLAHFLQSNRRAKVILATTFFEDGLVEMIKSRGAIGYFHRNVRSFTQILDCIRNVYYGKNFFTAQ
jgi:DNA-binding NarL/FixJ family response regulator